MLFNTILREKGARWVIRGTHQCTSTITSSQKYCCIYNILFYYSVAVYNVNPVVLQ